MHRYYAHRSYKMKRWFRFVVTAIACLAGQKGPLWWTYSHMPHHRFSETEKDPHSPWVQGYWLAQLKWFFAPKTWNLDMARVPKEFRRCRELVLLERFQPALIIGFAALILALFGIRGFLWGFCLPTVLIWQGIHCSGIFGHKFGGYRRYATTDQSRNKWLLSIFLLGEGWHNNHHHVPYSARMGFFWYEYDPTYWVLKIFSWLGLVYAIRTPSDSAKYGVGRAIGRRLHSLRLRVVQLRSDLESAVDSELGGASTSTSGIKESIAIELDEFEEQLPSLVRERGKTPRPQIESLREAVLERTDGHPSTNSDQNGLRTAVSTEIDQFAEDAAAILKGGRAMFAPA
jgi:stearoyl-CoA desaturase (delta-9 desaturase)